jgi:hypothetical protein
VPDHRPADGGPGRQPDRGRRAAHGPAAAADPGSRPGRRRLPVLPLPPEKIIRPNGLVHAPARSQAARVADSATGVPRSAARRAVFKGGATGRARTRSPRPRPGR